MIKISEITTIALVIAMSCSESEQFGGFLPMMPSPPMNMRLPQMQMPSFHPMMPGFGNPSMPSFPMLNIHQKMIQAQMEAQARHHQMVMEQQRLMNLANAIAQAQASKPDLDEHVTDAALEEAEAVADALTDKLSSTSSESKESKEVTPGKHSSASSVSSEEIMAALKNPTSQVNGLKPLTSLPSKNFQSVSFSTSSSSSNINGVPSSNQIGQVTVNDNGKVTTKVF